MTTDTTPGAPLPPPRHELSAPAQGVERAIVVSALVTAWDRDPAALALAATQRLVGLVAEAEAGASLTWAVDVVAPGRLRLAAVVAVPHGTPAAGAGLAADVAGALGGPERWAVVEDAHPERVAALTAGLTSPSSGTSVSVVRSDVPGSARAAAGFSGAEPAATSRVWPRAVADDGLDLCAALLSAGPGSAYRVHLEAVGEVTGDAVLELAASAAGERTTTPTGLAEALRELGQPVRVRAVLHGPAGRSPAVRAAVRRLAGAVRFAADTGTGEGGDLLSPAAAAAFLRVPVTSGATAPGLVVHPARDVPVVSLVSPGTVDGVRLGTALDASGQRVPVVLPPTDLARHVHVVGQTGTGKSTLLEHLVTSALERGDGLAVIDAHGRLAQRVLSLVPRHRQGDVVAVDNGDRHHPVPLNPFAGLADDDVDEALLGITEMFYALFDPAQTGIVGPRFENWLQMGLRTLYDTDRERTSLLDVPRLFTDTDFLKSKFRLLKDPVVVDFWVGEMGQTSDFHKSEVLSWFRSRWARLGADRHLRAVLGSGEDAVDVDALVRSGGVAVISLGKGTLSDFGAQLLGYLYLMRFWRAAQRSGGRPFTLVVDEAHAFRVGALPTVLAEGRKYGLSVVVAHTHLAQLGPVLRSAVTGNVGTTIAFRSGVEDAAVHATRLSRDFPAAALNRLPNYTAAASLLVDGAVVPPFTLHVDPPEPGSASVAALLEAANRSRLTRTSAPEVRRAHPARGMPPSVRRQADLIAARHRTARDDARGGDAPSSAP